MQYSNIDCNDPTMEIYSAGMLFTYPDFPNQIFAQIWILDGIPYCFLLSITCIRLLN